MKISILSLIFFTGSLSYAQNTNLSFIDTSVYKSLRVKPSHTNKAISTWDTAHTVYYNPKITNNKILLFLAGTTGTPNNAPLNFLNTALEQGYRVIALSYITIPAVAQICQDDTLGAMPDCAALFRQKRIYGDNDFALIINEPQDAIIPRFTALLKWLSQNDKDGNWLQYLSKKQDKPRWNKIAVSGQSQGGGMSQCIAKKENVARVISFSGGWDYSNSKEKKIAGWYSNDAKTPSKKWYATYHTNEITAKTIAEICTALNIPSQNIFALDKPLMNANTANERSNAFHGEGVKNIAYKLIWIKMLGNGTK